MAGLVRAAHVMAALVRAAISIAAPPVFGARHTSICSVWSDGSRSNVMFSVQFD